MHDPASETVKRHLFRGFQAVTAARPDELLAALQALYAPDAVYQGSFPIEMVQGADAIAESVWAPLKRALRDLRRCDDIVIGGHFQGQDWVSMTGYLHGTFVDAYLGIPPTGNWAFLRYGEFHRIVDGRIDASFVIFDIVDLMRQAGVAPWRPGPGVETLMPGPRSGDGRVFALQDAAETARTFTLIEAMMFEGLLLFDGEDHASIGMERYWTRDMMWYGPGMIGATMGLDAFLRFHQEPWQAAVRNRPPMPTRENKHIARFADGPYACITGWPSIRATHVDTLLGVPATGLAIDIRVMDWWHRSGDLLDENWIFIDMPHLFAQLGIDLFARMRDAAGRKAAHAG